MGMYRSTYLPGGRISGYVPDTLDWVCTHLSQASRNSLSPHYSWLTWGLEPVAVVGHSSGEIAVAVAVGYLSDEEAIEVAYLRVQAVKQSPHDTPLGMLAVGLSAYEVAMYLDQDDRSVQIACFNSPRSLTLSGVLSTLEELRARLKPDGHFARLLHVSMASHLDHLAEVGTRYLDLLQGHIKDTASKTNDNKIAMISTDDGTELGNHLL
ncbi:polyketide synthase [Apiospora sp. TS-2023a]